MAALFRQTARLARRNVFYLSGRTFSDGAKKTDDTYTCMYINTDCSYVLKWFCQLYNGNFSTQRQYRWVGYIFHNIELYMSEHRIFLLWTVFNQITAIEQQLFWPSSAEISFKIPIKLWQIIFNVTCAVTLVHHHDHVIWFVPMSILLVHVNTDEKKPNVKTKFLI